MQLLGHVRSHRLAEICRAGEEADNCEPNARVYTCAASGEEQVYSAEALLKHLWEACDRAGVIGPTVADLAPSDQALTVERRPGGVRHAAGKPLEVQLEDRFAKEVMPTFHPAKIAGAAE